MATHSSILAWRIPGMGETGGLPSMGSHRVGHDWSDLAAAAKEIGKWLPLWLSGKESTCQCRRCRFNPWIRKIPWKRKWQPTPVFLPEESYGQRSWQARVHRVQFSSVAQSCPTLCNPMNRSTPGLPVHHYLPEFTQTHVHQVSDAIQTSHPLSSPSPPAPNPSQHQSLFQWVNPSNEVAKVLEFQLQHHSFQRNPRADLLQNGLVASPCSPRDS